MNHYAIISQIERFPRPIQIQILDYIEFLQQKYKPKKEVKKNKFKFDWEGGLKRTYPKISSVELQHKLERKEWHTVA